MSAAGAAVDPGAFDPRRHAPTVGELDLHLLAEGGHLRLWEVLGAHVRTVGGVAGTSFAVWAPNARRVSVVGDFSAWDPLPLRPLGGSGVHEAFVPGVAAGALYKLALLDQHGTTRLKSDPYGRLHEPPPGNASIVVGPTRHLWGDGDWLAARAAADPLRAPLLACEVHLPSFVQGAGQRQSLVRELAPRLLEHCRTHGFTHVELMPVMEHPFGGSWGYQVTGYYAPTSRWGHGDDLRFLVDTLHRGGVGVLLDWVPAHFPADPHGLARFDGTALYEHEDPRQGVHPDWRTLIFNYGRAEVGNFLLANALYWIEEFHADGLRVDAVASLLYLDYSRKEGEWIPNRHGGRENLEALAFLRRLNATVRERHPGVLMVAEESTAFPGVTAPLERGGLGFHFKWNMGWMHDTLEYFSIDPLFRGGAADKFTFAMLYEHSERFLMPLSHDEVVHGKGSLYARMPGDDSSRLANLRLLLAYQLTRPGKKLLFMGTELGDPREWDHERGLDWGLLQRPERAGLSAWMSALGQLYRSRPCLWRGDPDPGGFRWVVCDDRRNSVFAWLREAGDDRLLIVLNMTPVERQSHRLGVPEGGRWKLLLSSADARFGGAGPELPSHVTADAEPMHGQPQSLSLRIPGLAALVLAPVAADGTRATAARRTRKTTDATRTGTSRPRAPRTRDGGGRKR